MIDIDDTIGDRDRPVWQTLGKILILHLIPIDSYVAFMISRDAKSKKTNAPKNPSRLFVNDKW